MMIGGPKEPWITSIRSSRRSRRASATSRARRAARRRFPRRARLHSRRPIRRRALRQDGAQRHRVRIDAGLCRGLRHPAQQGLEGSAEDERFTLNLPDIAEVWRRGSVISSWLLDLGAAALAKDPQLKSFSGFVQDSGEGRWTVEAAIEEAVPANVITAALYARFRSRQEHTFGEKMLSAMRFGFGGHVEGAEPIDPEPKPQRSVRSAAE
jgi:6-phosphogluconate dehydrogenase